MVVAPNLETPVIKRLRLLVVSVFLCLPAQIVLAGNFSLVVSGLGGEQSYSDSFSDTASAVYESLQTLDVETDRITLLDESATRDDILQALSATAEKMRQQSSPVSVFSLFLIGHGNANSDGWRFNIKGPDLSTVDIVAALNEFPPASQLIVLAASSSGAALSTLSQPQRVVVSATKSGGESNAVRFPIFMAEALRTDQADFDKNEILTMAEVYRFAENRTVDYYEQQKLLVPEHSRLRSDEPADIPVALLGSLKFASDDPEVALMLTQRLELEEQFKTLRKSKASFTTANYYDELEQLLIKIARLQQSIDVATGWSENDADS